MCVDTARHPYSQPYRETRSTSRSFRRSVCGCGRCSSRATVPPWATATPTLAPRQNPLHRPETSSDRITHPRTGTPARDSPSDRATATQRAEQTGVQQRRDSAIQQTHHQGRLHRRVRAAASLLFQAAFLRSVGQILEQRLARKQRGSRRKAHRQCRELPCVCACVCECVRACVCGCVCACVCVRVVNVGGQAATLAQERTVPWIEMRRMSSLRASEDEKTDQAPTLYQPVGHS